MVKLAELVSYLDELWPPETADDWDRPGLSVGSLDSNVTKVLLTVDVTKDVVSEAIELGANLIISHHPLLLRGVNEVTEQSLKGQILTLAIKNDVAIFAAHTNSDKAALGTATALAELYGLTETRVLDEENGHGLIGRLPKPIALLDFAKSIAKKLPPVAAGIKVAGDHSMLVSSVAISPGAGDADLGKALAAGVDVFITSDLRHHPSQDFIETPGAPRGLIDVSHWASESVYLAAAAKHLAERFPSITFLESEIRTDPWDFAVMQ